MLPLYMREQARVLDVHATSHLKVPSLLLMENAGRGAADWIEKRFGAELEGETLIVGGSGNNGGDGWVVARQLMARGYKTKAILVGDPAKLSEDSAANFNSLKAMGCEPVVMTEDVSALTSCLGRARLVVDALFGTGLSRNVEGRYLATIQAINNANRPVVALDVPSGLDVDTGNAWGEAVRATLTVTLGGLKVGLYQHPGSELAGEVVLVNLGFDASAGPHSKDSSVDLADQDDVRAWVSPRKLDSHKHSDGSVAIVAGSRGKTGSAYLSALGALRTGAGAVSIATRENAYQALENKVIEVMTETIPEQPDAVVDFLKATFPRLGAAVIGPGLGLDAAGQAIAMACAESLPVPAVLDADALTALSALDRPFKPVAPRVLTPHAGEAARLLKITTNAIQNDRLSAARELARRYTSHVVLKGPRSLVADPHGRVLIIKRGNPVLATAGSGDVLGGAIAALMLTLGGLEASAAGTVLHALAGELATQGDRGLLAREIADSIPQALSYCGVFRSSAH